LALLADEAAVALSAWRSPLSGRRCRHFTPRPAEETTMTAAEMLVEEETSATQAVAPRRTATVLLAECEPGVREAGKRILQGQGYEVILAADGSQALELFQQERDNVDLVILDLNMPKVSGQEVYRDMHALDPDVRILFASHYLTEDHT